MKYSMHITKEESDTFQRYYDIWNNAGTRITSEEDFNFFRNMALRLLNSLMIQIDKQRMD